MDTTDSIILNKKPSEDKWSAIQVLYHLEFSESLSRSYMYKKLNQIDQQDETGIKSAIRSVLLKVFLNTPLKFKAPPTVATVPDDADYSALKEKYLDGREELGKLLEMITDEHTGKAIMKHPRVGPINIWQTMDFFESHFLHHRKQILNLIKAG